MTRDLTCIICPRGCQLHVALEDGKILEVTGNTCPRGKTYAETECTHPTRTLTTTVRTKDGSVLPVRTDKPIPLELLFDAMGVVDTIVAPKEVHIGTVLLENILNTGANIIATAHREEEKKHA